MQKEITDNNVRERGAAVAPMPAKAAARTMTRHLDSYRVSTCEYCDQVCLYPLNFGNGAVRRLCMDHMRALEPECAEVAQLLLDRIPVSQTINKRAVIPQMDDAGIAASQ